MIRSYSAWFIHRQWLGNTSAKVFFFTKELGLISCFYKGGRTPAKQALLQPFTPLWISLEERYQRSYIRSVESLASTLPLQGSALFSALYLNELLYYCLSPFQSEEVLFNAYVESLKGLTAQPCKVEIEFLLRQFEWSLLQACGRSFSLTSEAKTECLIKEEACYRFIPNEGLICASEGIVGKHILAFAAGNFKEEGILHSIKLLMRMAMDALVEGKKIHSRDLFK